jgi:hypothetical protein
MKQDAEKGNPVLVEIIEKLNESNTGYYTCHCTGLEQYKILKESIKNNLNYIASGTKNRILKEEMFYFSFNIFSKQLRKDC